MKKLLLAILVLSLTFSCFAFVLTANAATEITVDSNYAGKDYFKLSRETMKSIDFENASQVGSDVWLKYATGSISHETANPIDKTGSIKSVAGEAGYAFLEFVYSATYAARNDGDYFVEFDVKPVKNANAAVVMIYVNDAERIAQVGVSFTLDESGMATDAQIVDAGTVGGWPETNYHNAMVKSLGNGAFRVYFEYTVSGTINWESTGWAPFVTFAQRATSVDNAVLWDNINFGRVITPAYYNIDWNLDFEAGWDTVMPFKSVSYDFLDGKVNQSKALTFSVAEQYCAADVRATLNEMSDDKKLIKTAGKIYFQYDVYTDAQTVNIYTLDGLWSEINWDGTSWSCAGLVSDFRAIPLSHGYRLSYYIDMTNYANNVIYIKTGSTVAHEIAFDNFIVAHEDTILAPWASDTVSYLYPTASDVNVEVDLKGKDLTSLQCNGQDLAADMYSIAGNTLTLKAAVFANAQKGQDYTFTLTTTGGNVSFNVVQLSTLVDVTAVGPEEPVTKYFDNNAEVKEKIELSLNGVAEGDEVTISYTDAVYTAAAAGDVDVRITGLKLGGKDAYKYSLTSDTITISGKILPLISVTAVAPTEAIVKYEDGTTNANAQITLSLQGVLEGDEVTVSYTSVVFDSAEVGNTTLTISGLTLSGKDAAKYTLANNTVTANGTILARSEVTVSYNGSLITKRYDGTTAVGKLVLDVNGIAEGDDVSVTYSAAYDSVEAGDRRVVISNIVLYGNDAYKYKVATETISADGWISEIKQIAVTDNGNYYTVDGKTLVDINFNNYGTGSATGSVVNGLYIGSTAEIVELNGQKVLKVSKSCDAWATELFATNTTGSYRTPGVYAVSFSIKPTNATMFTAIVRNSYANDASGIIADFRWTVSCDENGNVVSISKDVQGWTGADQKYYNAKAELNPETGWIDCYFEFTLSAGLNYQDGFMPNVTFMGANAAGVTSDYYYSNIKYLCVSNSDKYFTKDYELDFENMQEGPYGVTPFWAQTEDMLVYDSEWTNSTTVMYLVGANNSRDTQVGGLNNDEGSAVKLFKGHGLHYVQFDFDTTCKWVNFYSHSDTSFTYFSVQCNNNDGILSFITEGAVRNFSAVKLSNEMYRISFFVDMTDSSYDRTWVQINAETGSEGGEIIFDNLFVAHEDYSPIASNGTYNFFETEDVVVSADVKGAKLMSVLLDGQAIASDLYSYDYATGKLTLNKTLFAGAQLGAADKILKIVTLDGEVSCALSIVDNRPDSVTLNKTELELQVGQSETVVAEAIRDVVWSSSDATVATVENGVIVAVGAGTATITATSGTASATITVTVTKAPAQASAELAQAVAAIDGAKDTEAKFNAIKGAINIYNALEEDVKQASAADFAKLQTAIAAYNSTVTAANQEMNNAISYCISNAALVLTAAGAVLFLLKRKLF